MKILGLDLGTNSVGWALIERKNDDFKDIIDAGSRIVPLDPDLKKNFETGQAVSKTGDRRGTRGSRRLNARFRMRRDSLLRCLLAVGILPEIPDLDAEPQALDNLLLGKVATALELYEIRALATKEKVSLAELGRVLLHLNQRRGYQPTRSEKRKNSDNTDSTYGYFRIEEVKKTGEILSKKPELEVLLSNGKVGFSPDAQFEQLVGKEVPIEIKETTNKKKEVSVKLSLIGEKEDSWASRLGAMESELTASGQTPGQFYFRKLQEAGQSGEAFRIRQRLVYRTNYLAEFDQIWAEQIKHHPELADSNIFDKVIEAVMTPHNPMKNAWKKKGLGTFIRDFIIYFQRPLRSQKGSIGHCNFETEFPRRVIPKSHPFFQEFKLWNQINNLKIVRVDGSEEEISVLAKERLFQELQTKPNMRVTAVAKICACKVKEIQMTEYLDGDSTVALLRKAAKEAEIAWEGLAGKKEMIWHILYSLEDADEEVIQKALVTQVGIPLDKTEPFLKIFFDKQYGGLSAKAIAKLLPLMRVGEHFEVEKIRPEVAEHLGKLMNGEEDAHLSAAVRKRFADREKLEDFSGLQYWAAASLVYGDHRQIRNEEAYKDWKDIELLPLYALRNPVVEQIVNETLQVVKAVWKQHGRPDRIHLEMARSLKQNAKQRGRASKKNTDREKEREMARKILVEEFNMPRPSRKNIERYLLWKEAGMCCIYSGKKIPRSALFNGETDIDHIIPRQRFFDDSFNNKVLVFEDINQNEKKNLTAFEYKQHNGWESYKNRVESNDQFKPQKKKYLLMESIPDDFINRQLQDTSYIAKRIRVELEKVCPPVITEEGKRSPRVMLSSGMITNYLKGHWRLHEIFKLLLVKRYERFGNICEEELIEYSTYRDRQEVRLKGFSKRIDHRHHAMDAIVVATTRQRDIQILNQLGQHYEKNGIPETSLRKIPCPHTLFREKLQACLAGMVVSHKSRTRLITKRVNRYPKRTASGKVEIQVAAQKSTGIRGALHEETVYGRTKQYLKIAIKNAFAQVDALVVEWQKAKVQERLDQLGGDVGKAIKSLKKEPLADLKGEALEKVTILEEVITQNVALGSLSLAQINKELALDREIGRELKAHLAKYADLKAAFSQEGVFAFNQGRKNKVYSVKLKVSVKPIALNPDSANPRLVKPGGNYGAIVREGAEGKRIIEVISFYDAVQLAREGLPVFEAKPGYKSFLLQKRQAVYVLKPDEEVENVDWTDKVGIAERIYICRQVSEGRAFFLPHLIAKVLGKKDGFTKAEYGSKNATEFHDADEPRTKIIQRCIRVHVDHLGNVSPIRPKS